MRTIKATQKHTIFQLVGSEIASERGNEEVRTNFVDNLNDNIYEV